MSDKERRENDALKNLIQAAYDFSDEQILAELEETEATLSDSDFPGIEDRIYQKLKARMAEKEEKPEEIESSENTDEEPIVSAPVVEEKKVVRFGKKKAVVVGLLAAAFVGMLGVTAIGGKNYFFKEREKKMGIVFTNDKFIQAQGELNDAYDLIENELAISVMKLGYIPNGMDLVEMEITATKASLFFKYDDKYFHFIQEKMEKETSIGVNSDRRKTKEKVDNNWINECIYLEEELLEDGSLGLAGAFTINNVRYYLAGQLSKDEMISILENLIF